MAFQPITVRVPYNYDTNLASQETYFHSDDVGLTQQQFKDDCDINIILDRIARTGDFPQDSGGQYGDFTDMASDYHAVMNCIIEAKEEFNALPFDLRKRFDFSSEKLVAFLEDVKNLQEAQDLGLVNRDNLEQIVTESAP